MKKQKKKLAQNSLEIRNLTRHPMPPPSFSLKDRKKESNRKECRKNKKKVIDTAAFYA
jgi:hypothetical protein